MIKVWWTEHKTNEEILQIVETEREMMDTVRSRQNRWLGHILRHDSLLRIMLEEQIQGKKVYGRPRTVFLDWLLKTEEGNISYCRVLSLSDCKYSLSPLSQTQID